MIDDVYKVALVMRLQDSICINTFHYRTVAEAADVDHAAAIMDLLWTILETPFKAATTGGLQYLQLEAHKVWPLPIGGTFIKLISGTGTLTGDTYPSEVSAVLKKLSLLGGRTHRGRIYLPGQPISSCREDSGLWDGSALTRLAAAAAVLNTNLDDFAGSSFEPGVWNRTTGAFTSTPFSGVNPVPRSQRRRQAGVGI